MKISGFTLVHNGISGGYPFVEAITAVQPYVDEVVAVDIESTDGTDKVLRRICHKVLTSTWDGRDTTPRAFLKHTECKGDIIIFFEADEIYDDGVLSEVLWAIERGHADIGVWRIQITQNFQRCKEYPIPVHRIFPQGRGTYHLDPIGCPDYVAMLPPAAGYLWDVSNCFRDNWFDRKRNQAEIWGEPRHLMVAKHFTEPNEITAIEEENNLNEAYWQWTQSPFSLPAILKPLVGKTRYEVRL